MRIPQTPSISFFPGRQEFKQYGWGILRADLFAAFAVALATIPQSIAYSLLAGLPPSAGIFSAIFGTILCAAWGSSRHLVSGPSTGVAILIQTSVSDVLHNYFGAVSGIEKEALTLHILGQIVLFMGFIQIGFAFFNVSKLLQFVSRPVILGYFGGIVLAIIINQLFYFFGIPSAEEGSVLYKSAQLLWHLPDINFASTLVGVLSLFLLIFLRKRWQTLPGALVVLIFSAVLSHGFNFWLSTEQEPFIATLKQFEVSTSPIPDLTFPLVDLSLINKIFPASVAVAFLAILEVFSISRAFAARSGHQVNINQDVFGLGIANTALSFLYGAMPASGSATRTTLNFEVGAKTRLAAILSGVLIAGISGFFWPLIAHIPLVGLAALLIATAPGLINWKEIRLAIRATLEDRWIFFLTFFSCLIFSLDIAFFIGILISIATYLRKSAVPHLVEYAFNSKGRLVIVVPKEEVHRKVRIIGIAGELYFAAAEVFQKAMQTVAEDPHVQAIVLRLNNVYHMDASMCLAIQGLYETLQLSHRHLVISGLTEEVWRVFYRSGLVKQIGQSNLYFTDESNPQFSTWKACLHAQELIQGAHRALYTGAVSKIGITSG